MLTLLGRPHQVNVALTPSRFRTLPYRTWESALKSKRIQADPHPCT